MSRIRVVPRRGHPISDARHIMEGVKAGIPMCCIAQYVNDGYNRETWDSAIMRRGNAWSEEGDCFYVPCYDCDEDCDEETRFSPDFAWKVRRPKVLISRTPMKVR